MAALTLFEAAKLHGGSVFRQGVIETIGTYGSVYSVIPFMDISGASYTYNREEALSGIAFRGVNESFTSETSVVNPQTEVLKISGGQIDVDKFIVDAHGEDQREMQERMKMKGIALDWGKTFFKGDSEQNVREFDGLQKRLVGSQLIDAGATSGGDALSLEKLDELIDAVDTPTHLFMNRTMARRLNAATRNTGVSGFITWSQDEFGRRVQMYNDLPIVLVDEDSQRNQILPFTEAAPAGGTAQCTSIYCASIGDGQLMGIQNGTMDARDLGLLDDGTKYRTVVEHYNGIVLLGDKSAARLRGVTNAPVVA